MSLSKYIEQKAQAFEDQQERDRRLASELIDCIHCGTPRDPKDEAPCCAATEEQETEKELAQLRAELAAAENQVDALNAQRAADAERALRAVEEAERSKAFAYDWFGQRFNCLRRWVDEEVRPLSVEVATRYFSICANGSPSPHESADWRDTLHARTIRAERAEAERDALKAELADAKRIAEARLRDVAASALRAPSARRVRSRPRRPAPGEAVSSLRRAAMEWLRDLDERDGKYAKPDGFARDILDELRRLRKALRCVGHHDECRSEDGSTPGCEGCKAVAALRPARRR